MKEAEELSESDKIIKAELLMKELREILIPVNTLLVEAKQLGLSICVQENYSNPQDETELVSPQVGVRFIINLCS